VWNVRRNNGNGSQGKLLRRLSKRTSGEGRVVALPGGKAAELLFDTVNATTDSVVAHLTVKTKTTMRRLDVDWGDGKKESLTRPPGTTDTGLPFRVPRGTYEFFHHYDAPELNLLFSRVITVTGRDGSRTEVRVENVTLIPLYRITFYRASVHMLIPCDPNYEVTSEFDIVQVRSGLSQKKWRWEPPNVDILELDWPPHRLPGSQFMTVVPFNQPVFNTFAFTETDWLDDDSFSVTGWFTAAGGSTHYRGEHKEDGLFHFCWVEVEYDVDVTLSVPMPPQSGPVLSPARWDGRLRRATTAKRQRSRSGNHGVSV
jgi:hypothetical protein